MKQIIDIYKSAVLAFAVIGIFFSNPIYATPQSIDPNVPLAHLMVDQWQTEQGLISNNLTSVFQATDGFIWITTFNGLMRFDGQLFTLYDKDYAEDVFYSNALYKTYEYPAGTLWFGTQGSSIIKLKNSEFTQIAEIGLPRSVRCLLPGENRIWAGTNNQGLYYTEDSIFKSFDTEKLKGVTIQDIKKSVDGSIWVATVGKGVIQIKGNKTKYYTRNEGFNEDIFNLLYPLEDGRVLVCSIDRIYSIENETISELEQFRGVNVNDIVIGANDSWWFATETGIIRYNESDGTYEALTDQTGLPARQISSLCFDHEGSLWLATKKSGLLRLKEGSFTNYSILNGLSMNNTNVVIEHERKFFVGSDDGSIDFIENGQISNLPLQTNLSNVGIRDIIFDNEGNLWIGSYKGLLKVKGQTETLITTADGLSSNEIRKFYLNDDGFLWVATKSGGINVLKEDKIVNQYTMDNGLESNYIFCIEKDHKGNILLGTYSGGMSVISSNNKIKNYKIEDDSSGILIFNIDVDENNTYWLSTNIGIYRFENEVFQKVIFEKEPKTETFFDIILDRNGNVWMTSNMGLLMAKKQDFEAQKEGKIDSVSIIKIFDNHDGMLTKECTGAVASLLASNDEIWIPTLSGVAVLNSNEVSFNTIIPKVYITALQLNGKFCDLTSGKVSVNPGDTRYSFQFTALSMLASSKNRFRYKLEGFDNEWVEAYGKREAIYANLSPGKYTFHVVASNNDGYWNETGDSLDIVVKPFFYQTGIFIVLVIFLGILSLYLLYNWRVEKVNRRNKELAKLNDELDRFVYSASHDLRAPLASVQGLVEIASKDPTIKGKDECLNLIDLSIKKLDRFTKEIIDYSRNTRTEIEANPIDFKVLIEDTFQELKHLDKDEKITFKHSITLNSPFYSDHRRLSVIINNLISNAIIYHNKYREDPFIEVLVNVEKNNASIKVIDNGRGIESAHINNIFKMFYRATQGSNGSGLGLYIVKETLDKLKGKVFVESKVGEGTVFSLSIPSLKNEISLEKQVQLSKQI